MNSLVLLVPDKPDPERDAVAAAWERAGGTVVRLARFWEPPNLDRTSVRVYGNDTFCLVLAEKLALELLSPPDRVLANVPRTLLARTVRIVPLASLAAQTQTFPAFVKPVIPKQFMSAVYASAESLAVETRGLEPDVEVIVADVVEFVAEARAFVLEGAVKACAVYEGAADVRAASDFAARVVGALAELPRTCVVDVGLLADGRWALVECNATWGAGLNGCEASDVVACIEAASRPAP